jgi:hypothetical protein
VGPTSSLFKRENPSWRTDRAREGWRFTNIQIKVQDGEEEVEESANEASNRGAEQPAPLLLKHGVFNMVCSLVVVVAN